MDYPNLETVVESSAKGTVRLSEPSDQITMEQKSTESLIEESAVKGRPANLITRPLGRISGRRMVDSAIQRVAGNKSRPCTGGELTGSGASGAEGRSMQQQHRASA